MKQQLKELNNILTKLKQRAGQLKSENSSLRSENDHLKLKVALLSFIISLALITWLVSDQK